MRDKTIDLNAQAGNRGKDELVGSTLPIPPPPIAKAEELKEEVLKVKKEEAESGNKLEQFLEWLEHEEDAYPILHHGILIAFAEKYVLEKETSSEKEANVL